MTAAGELFTWGDDGRDGQLGLGDKGAQLLPNRVEVLQGEWVIAVSAGVAHTVAVTRGGSVFGWGDTGVLGLHSNAHGSESVDGVECVLSPCPSCPQYPTPHV